MTVTLNVLPLPTCNDCGHPVKRAKSIQERLCCCSRGTCHTPEPFGCIVCGAFLIGRTDEVLGVCVRCQVVTQSPGVAVAPRCAAAGTNSRRDPSCSAESVEPSAGSASQGAAVATGPGEDPTAAAAPDLTTGSA